MKLLLRVKISQLSFKSVGQNVYNQPFDYKSTNETHSLQRLMVRFLLTSRETQ